MDEKWGVDGKRSVSLFIRVAQPGAKEYFWFCWTLDASLLRGQDGSPARSACSPGECSPVAMADALPAAGLSRGQQSGSTG